MASPQGVAVIVPVTQGQEDALRYILEGINQVRADSITIDFARKNRTHFARFVLLDDFDRKQDTKRLLFSGIYDGSPAEFFTDLRDQTSDLDAIFGKCETYQGKANFVDYMLANNNPTGTFLKGFRFETVETIQGYLRLRRNLIEQFNVPVAEYDRVIASLPTQSQGAANRKRIIRDVREFAQKVWVTIKLIPQLVGLLRFGTQLLEARKYITEEVTLDRDHTLAPYDKSAACHPLDDYDEVVREKAETELLPFMKRQQVQNQMTIVTGIDPKLLRRQEAIMAYINTLASIPFVTRNASIPTIHFGRWLPVDNGRRLLFLSNFDGSWESYIGDFVDKAANGLDAFWSGGFGWRQSATLDIELFKEGIRCHQTRASYFYCAYPDATVVNIGKARDLARAYDLNVDESTAREWLKLL